MRTVELTCTLTPEEVAEKHAHRDDLEGELEKIEDAFAKEKARFTTRRKEIETEMRQLSRQARSRTEIRAVRVLDQPDYGRHVMETVRQDTGEVVASRALTDKDRQLGILREVPVRQAD